MKIFHVFLMALVLVGCSDKLVIKGQGTYGQKYNTAEIHFEGAVPGLSDQQIFLVREAMRTRMFNEDAFYQGRGLFVRYSVAEITEIAEQPEGFLQSISLGGGKDNAIMRMHFTFYDAGGNVMDDYDVTTGYNTLEGDDEFYQSANEAAASAVQYMVNRYRLTY